MNFTSCALCTGGALVRDAQGKMRLKVGVREVADIPSLF